jgi:hypothetical protein
VWRGFDFYAPSGRPRVVHEHARPARIVLPNSVPAGRLESELDTDGAQHVSGRRQGGDGLASCHPTHLPVSAIYNDDDWIFCTKKNRILVVKLSESAMTCLQHYSTTWNLTVQGLVVGWYPMKSSMI